MSLLRSQFQSARSAYESVSYPGDLPTEILGPIAPVHWYKWPIRLGFGGLAVAAAVAWVVLLSRPVKPGIHRPGPSELPRESVAVVPNTAPGLSLSPPALLEMPEMPDWSGMPELPTMPAGFTGSAVPLKAPSLVPDMIPLEPPGFPPAMVPAASHGTSTKEPA